MLYVMWKNVGRLLASTHGHGHGHPPSRVSLFRGTFFAGPVLGLMLLVVGLAVFIIYEVQVSGEGGQTQQALVIYYSFNIACLGLMTLVSLGGSVIYRFDRRAMDHHKNPTRTLDVALLMGAALGQYAISYYSIVAVVVGMPKDVLGALDLAHALLMIAQHTFQNVFIIESLHRGPPGAEPHDSPPKEPCLTFANLDALHTLPTCPPTPRLDGPSLAGPQETIAIILAPRGHWRRRCLKDISLFLLLCNIIVSTRAMGVGRVREENARKGVLPGAFTGPSPPWPQPTGEPSGCLGKEQLQRGSGAARADSVSGHTGHEGLAFWHPGSSWSWKGPREF